MPKTPEATQPGLQTLVFARQYKTRHRGRNPVDVRLRIDLFSIYTHKLGMERALSVAQLKRHWRKRLVLYKQTLICVIEG
jgi:hypothetical protein